MWATAQLNTPSCTVVLEFLEVYNGAFFSIKRSGECRRGRGDMRHGARGKMSRCRMSPVEHPRAHSSLALRRLGRIAPTDCFIRGSISTDWEPTVWLLTKTLHPTAHNNKQVTTGLHEAGGPRRAGGEVRATAGRHPAPRGLSTPCAGRGLSHAPRG